MSELDDRLAGALEALLARHEHAVELCPRCVKRPQDGDNGFCRECEDEIERRRHERAKARKRRWWHEKGKYQRRERREEDDE